MCMSIHQLPVMFFGVVFVEGKVFARVFAFPGTARPALDLAKKKSKEGALASTCFNGRAGVNAANGLNYLRD